MSEIRMGIEMKFESLDLLILDFVGVKGKNGFLTIKEIMDLSHKYGSFDCTIESVRAEIITLAKLHNMYTTTNNGLIDGIGI